MRSRNACYSAMNDRHRWLLLMHQLPPQPDYFRVKVWRRLRAIGAAAVKNSVYVLPNTSEAREDFEWLMREIIAGGGEASLCEATFLAGLTDSEISELLRERGELRHAERGQERASAATPAGPASSASSLLPTPWGHKPHGAVWVTRRNIHVDRIASVWLIWRFIDPAARFKFVDGTDYERKPNELRFDMFAAEYTHVGPKCTFEVLLDAFGLQADVSLAAIGEIVHDIDLKENTFAHAATADTSRTLDELHAEYAWDEGRLEHGAVLFENLYALLEPAADASMRADLRAGHESQFDNE